jgi:hypothetical protein
MVGYGKALAIETAETPEYGSLRRSKFDNSPPVIRGSEEGVHF